MFDFQFDPLTVGDTSTLGFTEELQEELVNDAIEFIRRIYGDSLTKQQMDIVLTAFDINYFELPEWLRYKFDDFNIMEG